jgi:glucosamine--fructose-6-phosphate aminotransferase (isomerizing)
MCGIVGYVGGTKTKDVLVEGLKRLEYRGYDSAGVAFSSQKGNTQKIVTVRSVGKVATLEELLADTKEEGTSGIAHTRWATHGIPSEKNSHPHRDCTGRFSLVHNGIIENYLEIKSELEKKGHVFKSATDTEVIVHLIEEFVAGGNSVAEAFQKTLGRIVGTYGLVLLALDEPETLYVARMGSPLVIGVGDQEHFVASDISAILAHTSKVVYLEDGEWAVVKKESYQVKSIVSKKKVAKEIETVDWTEGDAQRGGYAHFMLKEIFEQPKSIADAIRGRIDIENGTARLGGLREVKDKLANIERIIIVSCGTSYHAGLVGEYMIEEYAGIPVEVEFASEFRYRKPLITKKTVVLVISQSGETADTLAALREAKRKGALTLGIVNVVGSTIARETDAGVYNHAGPEVSVASTKAFTSQLAILTLLAVYLGRQRDMSLVTGQRILRELVALPKKVEKILAQERQIKQLAKKFQKVEQYLYVGRKYNFPVAYEGALKIKEIAYVAAQGYPTGEMKHGPIALIDKSALAVAIVPKDSVYEKNVSGLHEIKARGGAILGLISEGDTHLAKELKDTIVLPKTLEMLTPILAVVPLQLFSYYMSVSKGYDVDQPRNLAKSVTVE